MYTIYRLDFPCVPYTIASNLQNEVKKDCYYGRTD